jgi:SPP1 family predicted phage head-tail adaptor
MRAGELKQRIELQTPSRSLNSMNELIDTYATTATIWAAIEPLTGNRLFLAQQANSEVQGICRIRYRTDVNPLMRIKYGTRYFQIIAIIDRDELNKELLLTYKEITI